MALLPSVAVLAFAKVGLWLMSRTLTGADRHSWLRPLWFVLGLGVVFLFGIGS